MIGYVLLRTATQKSIHLLSTRCILLTFLGRHMRTAAYTVAFAIILWEAILSSYHLMPRQGKVQLAANRALLWRRCEQLGVQILREGSMPWSLYVCLGETRTAVKLVNSKSKGINTNSSQYISSKRDQPYELRTKSSTQDVKYAAFLNGEIPLNLWTARFESKARAHCVN